MRQGQHFKPSHYENYVKPLVDEVKAGVKDFTSGVIDSMAISDDNASSDYAPKSLESFYDQDEGCGYESLIEDVKLSPIIDLANLSPGAKKVVAVGVLVGSSAVSGFAYEAPAAAATPSAGANSTPAVSTIIVKNGNTLTGIAAQVNPNNPQATANQIAVMNKLNNPNLIYPGESLKVPVASGAALGVVAKTLEAGQTISVLAQQYGFTLNQFIAANPGVNPNLVYAGEVYNIPIGNVNYTVSPGDNLWKIVASSTSTPAQTANVVNNIQALNPGVNPDTLQPGQAIVVPGNVAVAAESANQAQSVSSTASASVAPAPVPSSQKTSAANSLAPVLAAESSQASTSVQSSANTAPATGQTAAIQPQPSSVAPEAPATPTTVNPANTAPAPAAAPATTQPSAPNQLPPISPDTHLSQQSTIATAPSTEQSPNANNPGANNQQPLALPSPTIGAASANTAPATLNPKSVAAANENSGNLIGNVTIQNLADYLEANSNLTKTAIAGLIGNFEVESGFNTQQLQGQTIGVLTPNQSLTGQQQSSANVGWGLAQFTPPSKYINWAIKNNMNPNAMGAQLQYILQNYPDFTSLLNTSTTPQQAADIALNDFERPQDPAATQVQREQDAVQAYNVIVGSNSVTATNTPKS